MKKTRVLVIDDSVQFAQAAHDYLAADDRLEVLASAFSGEEALERIGRDRPDLVLTDLHMPGIDGLEVTRRLKARPSPPRVVVISLDDSPEHLAGAQLAGADAFLHKGKFGMEMSPLIDLLFRPRAPADTDGRPK